MQQIKLDSQQQQQQQQQQLQLINTKKIAKIPLLCNKKKNKNELKLFQLPLAYIKLKKFTSILKYMNPDLIGAEKMESYHENNLLG